MAYNEKIAQRVRLQLASNPAVTEKRMFGGLAFLLRGLMFVGVSDTSLMARVGKVNHADSLRREYVREMDFTGKSMNGYVFVDEPGIRSTKQLRFWLDRCEQFVSTLPPKHSK